MDAKLHESALRLVERAGRAGVKGKTESREALERLNRECEGHIPGWYIDLLTTVPLCGLQLGWQAYEPDEDSTGILWLQWSDADDMRGEMLEAYPGVAIVASAYVNAALDLRGNDPYYFPGNRGSDPPLYRVYHDAGDNASHILSKGLKLVAPTLSQFFETAVVGE